MHWEKNILARQLLFLFIYFNHNHGYNDGKVYIYFSLSVDSHLIRQCGLQWRTFMVMENRGCQKVMSIYYNNTVSTHNYTVSNSDVDDGAQKRRLAANSCYLIFFFCKCQHLALVMYGILVLSADTTMWYAQIPLASSLFLSLSWYYSGFLFCRRNHTCKNLKSVCDGNIT